jgi:hypothetical protein
MGSIASTTPVGCTPGGRLDPRGCLIGAGLRRECFDGHQRQHQERNDPARQQRIAVLDDCIPALDGTIGEEADGDAVGEVADGESGGGELDLLRTQRDWHGEGFQALHHGGHAVLGGGRQGEEDPVDFACLADFDQVREGSARLLEHARSCAADAVIEDSQDVDALRAGLAQHLHQPFCNRPGTDHGDHLGEDSAALQVPHVAGDQHARE